MLSFSIMRLPRLAFLLGLALPLATAARADEPTVLDRGSYEIRMKDRVIGRETMLIQNLGDSVQVTASTAQQIGTIGQDSLLKRATMKLDAYDLNLRDYYSEQRFHGHKLTRGLSLHDTMFTSYRDRDGRGAGDTFTRPPGHLFVLDPGMFEHFDLICRMLRGRPFEPRSVNLVVLGSETDTVFAAPLQDYGPDTLRWSGKRVPTRRVRLGGEGSAVYQIWMDREGRMLRFEHPLSGLRVNRLPPPVKRSPAPRKS
jgi:hypothetical protein